MTREHYSVSEWCKRHGISRSSFYRRLKEGRITVVKFCGRTLVPASVLPISLPILRDETRCDAVRHGETPKREYRKRLLVISGDGEIP